MNSQPQNTKQDKAAIPRPRMLLTFWHRLFVKIMLVFAVTLITTIVANTVLTRQISRLEFQSENVKEQLQSLAQDAVNIYETSGEKSLQRWYMRQYQALHIRILLLDKQNIKIGHSVGHHRMRAFMNEQYQKMHRLMPSTNMIKKFWDSPPPIKLRWEVTSSLGNHYTLLVLPSPFLKQKWESSLNKYYSLRLFITFIILIVASFWLSRYVAKPVRKLKQASMQMAKGDLSVRVGHQIGSRKDELGELAVAFDEMAEKVEKMIQQQKQLLTDISHEIKTPLTRQRLALSLAKDNGASDDLLQKIETQNIKLAELIDSLLTLTRLDEGRNR